MNEGLSVEILAIGTELLLGDIANTDAQFLSKELAALGIPVYGHSVVGDNRVRLKNALESAFSRASMVIAVGGLGPTQDDITKETAAEYFDRKLILDEASMQAIQRRFAAVGLPENVHKNALIPENSRTLPNDNGSAPGVWLEQDGKTLLLLPGPPHELEPMFKNYAVSFLREKTGRVFVSRTLKFSGIGESKIETQLLDLFEAQTNPTLALYAKVWECHLRITASAETQEEANDLITPVCEEIYTRLGDYIYGEGEDDLAGLVINALNQRSGQKKLTASPLTLAVAESCTGGLVTAALVAVPGASAVFREGLITYSNEAKISRLGVDPALLEKYRAVSPQVAAAMAEGAAKTSGADIGLSTTGIAGPGGGTPEKPVGTVYAGLYIKGREAKTLVLSLNGSRNQIRERAAMQALNFLRKSLLAQE
jgi:nicotinamide-nucleotide amidase